MNKLQRILLVMTALSVGACSNNAEKSGIPASPKRSASTISGIAHDGLITAGNVTVFAFDNAKIGAILGTAITDTKGFYNVSVTSPDRPVLIEVRGGWYKEEATGRTVTLNANQALFAVSHYISPQPLAVSVTYYTTLATALGEYLVSTGMETAKAIQTANDRIGKLINVDIVKTAPLDITDKSNATITASPEIRYGFATAGISKLMAAIAVKNNDTNHETYTSFYFINTAYRDLKNDGRLNGSDATGSVSFGIVPITAETYRHLLAENIFIIAASGVNFTSLGVKSISEMVLRLNSSPDDIFSGQPVVNFAQSNTPLMSNISLKTGDAIAKIATIKADVADDLGMNRVTLWVGNTLAGTQLFDSKTAGAVSFNLDTTPYDDGPHIITLKAVNDLGGETVLAVNNVNVANKTTQIANMTPPEGSYVRGAFTMSATVADSLKITETTYAIDSIIKGAAIDKLAPIFLVATLTPGQEIADGPRLFTIAATNEANFTTTKSHNYIVDNTQPTVTIDNVLDRGFITGVTDVKYTVNDLNFDRAELFYGGTKYSVEETRAGARFASINTTAIPDNIYSLVLSAFDKAGNNTQKVVQVYVDNTDPTLTLIQPKPGSGFSTEIPINVNLSDTNGLAKIEYLVNGVTSTRVLNGTPISRSDTLAIPNVVEGPTNLMMVLTDNAGRKSTATVPIYVDRSPATFLAETKKYSYSLTPTVVTGSSRSGVIDAKIDIALNPQDPHSPATVSNIGLAFTPITGEGLNYSGGIVLISLSGRYRCTTLSFTTICKYDVTPVSGKCFSFTLSNASFSNNQQVCIFISTFIPTDVTITQQ